MQTNLKNINNNRYSKILHSSLLVTWLSTHLPWLWPSVWQNDGTENIKHKQTCRDMLKLVLIYTRSYFTGLKIAQNISQIFVTLDHKTSHKGQFFENKIYTSPESWINKLSLDVWCMVCYDRTIIGWDTTIFKSGIWGCKKNLNIEKITFKVVQMKFLAMHITNQKLSFDISTVIHLLNIFMEHDLYLIS